MRYMRRAVRNSRMHCRHFHELDDLIADTPPLSEIDFLVFGLEGVELAIGADRYEILSKFSPAVATP